MQKLITVVELAQMLADLRPMEQLIFHHRETPDSPDGTFGALRIESFDADAIYLNYVGGGIPYVIDVTRENPEQPAIMESLASFLAECSPNDGNIYIEDGGITVGALAKRIMSLESCMELRLLSGPSEDDMTRYGVCLVSGFGASCIYLNCMDGGRPFIKDISTYDEMLTERELSQALQEYFYDGADGEPGAPFLLRYDAEETGTVQLQGVPPTRNAEEKRPAFSAIAIRTKGLSSCPPCLLCRQEPCCNLCPRAEQHGRETDR